MFYNYDIFNISFLILLFSLSFLTSYYFYKIYKIKFYLCISLSFFHNLIFIFYIIFQFTIGSDNLTYFLDYQDVYLFDLNTGIPLLKYLIKVISYTKINYVNINYLFSLISLIGIFYLLDIFYKINFKNKKKYLIFLAFFFIPSFHFWISGFSKDTITFFCLAYIIHNFLNLKDNKFFFTLDIIAVLFILFLVRPHIFAMLNLSLILSFLISKKYEFYKLIIFLFLAFLILFFVLYLILNKQPNLLNILTYIKFFDNLYISDPYTSIESRNFLFKMIKYIFGPNIFYPQKIDFLYLFLSMENTYLLLIFIFLINKNIFKSESYKKNSLLFFVPLIFLVLLSSVTSNLGISNRQKWMFLPPLFLFFCFTKFNFKDFEKKRVKNKNNKT
jgi:hypothetical protein